MWGCRLKVPSVKYVVNAFKYGIDGAGLSENQKVELQELLTEPKTSRCVLGCGGLGSGGSGKG